MHQCTLYSHHLDFDKVVNSVKHQLPKATVTVQDDGGPRKSISAKTSGGWFSKGQSLTINWRQRLTPSYNLENTEGPLVQNLRRMVGFVQSIPAENELVAQKFQSRIATVNSEISFHAETGFSHEFKAILRDIARELDAFIFAQPNDFFNRSGGQHFVDKEFNLILDTEGNTDLEDLSVTIHSTYLDEEPGKATDAQRARRGRAITQLSKRGIPTNSHLPLIEDEAVANIRTQHEVIDRIYGLFIVTGLADSAPAENLAKEMADKRINSLTPFETRLLKSGKLSQRQIIDATWRWESLYLLLWAIGRYDELPFPDHVQDSERTGHILFHESRDRFESKAKLRPTAEILDALDFIYQLHWAIVNARVTGGAIPKGVDASVVMERHYSLNWLTHYGGADWDDVTTDT